MVESHTQHHDALQDFHAWRRSPEAQLPGIGGPDFETECFFISQSKLEKYFERPRKVENLLDAVLNSEQRPAVDASYVRDYYLRSFATLLCIGEGSMIHHFLKYQSLRDRNLPHRVRPDEFPFTTPGIFNDFKNAQWQFCASNLERGMNEGFKGEEILPIIRRERIGEGGSAIIYKIVIDKDYNSLRPYSPINSDRRSQYKNTFVLKTYRPSEAEENYKAERGAHMNLRWAGNPPPHIVAYYGGFIHGNSYNNIFEYADQGTLEDFMKTTDPPKDIEGNLLFWDRLSDVIHGIMTIHGKIGDHSSASQFLNGWHQDVKPTNILVFGENGTSPYDRHFKIADLGLTHFKPSVSQPNDPSDFDAFGTRAYGAPETYRSHGDAESTPLQVTQSVDIWSIGCVFSEASVWAHYGWKRMIEYRRQRSVEIKNNGGGEGEHLFHYDGTLLNVVKNIHEEILRLPHTIHHITRSVLDRLVNDMLQHGQRPPAAWLFEKSKRLVKEEANRFDVPSVKLGRNSNGELVDCNPARISARRELPPREPPPSDDDLAPSSLSSRSQSSPHRHHHKSTSQNSNLRSVDPTNISQSSGQDSHVVPNPPPSTSTTANGDESSQRQPVQQCQNEPGRPTLSIDEGHGWKKKKKKGEYAVLPGSENLTYLSQRDHVFLIDNSNTMRQYRKDIERVISLLAYMLKDSDEDGLDIYFTQNLQKVNSKRSSKLTASIYQQAFVGISDMRGRLQNLLQEHINKFGTLVPPRKKFGRQSPPQPQRPLSFYILTDAKYQPNDVGGLIKDLVKSMIAKQRPKEHVALSFIRFGEDQASIAKLNELDHGLGLKAIGMDIVDHTYWNDNVWKQLLGPLNDWYDDDPP